MTGSSRCTAPGECGRAYSGQTGGVVVETADESWWCCWWPCVDWLAVAQARSWDYHRDRDEERRQQRAAAGRASGAARRGPLDHVVQDLTAERYGRTPR